MLRNSEEMDIPHAISNLPTYSNILNFDKYQYNYEIPHISLIKCDEEEDDYGYGDYGEGESSGGYFDVHSCRPQLREENVISHLEVKMAEIAILNHLNHLTIIENDSVVSAEQLGGRSNGTTPRGYNSDSTERNERSDRTDRNDKTERNNNNNSSQSVLSVSEERRRSNTHDKNSDGNDKNINNNSNHSVLSMVITEVNEVDEIDENDSEKINTKNRVKKNLEENDNRHKNESDNDTKHVTEVELKPDKVIPIGDNKHDITKVTEMKDVIPIPIVPIIPMKKVPGSTTVIVSESFLCECRNGKIENLKFTGSVGVNFIKEKIAEEDGNEKENDSAENRENDSGSENKDEKDNKKDHDNDGNRRDDTTGTHLHETTSTDITIQNLDGIITNIVGNSSFISPPIPPLPETEKTKKQKITISNISVNENEKISPILRYSTVSSFQPYYLQAKSVLKIDIPNVRILIKVVFNPIFETFLLKMGTLIIQASMSFFSFGDSSKVIIRDCDSFNEASKIITWVVGRESLNGIGAVAGAGGGGGAGG